MFTGIIQTKGEIAKIEDLKNIRQITINAAKILENKKIGDSIAINGICSTLTAISEESFEIQYMKETLKLTTASKWEKGEIVNLEGSIKAGDSFDGHFVQGHIDCIGEIEKIEKDEDTMEMTIIIPKQYSKYTAIKGSITVNGVSLTISKIEIGKFKIALIPHTIKETNLGDLKEGDEVNIEIDMIARYLKQLLDQKEEQITYEFLRERNII